MLPVVDLFNPTEGLAQGLDQVEDLVAVEPRLAQLVLPLAALYRGVPLLLERVCVLCLNH